MPTSAVPVSRSERAALADLLEQLGPDQPTCCEGWTTQDMATHLVLRDRRPDAMPGLALGGPV
ncbi:maleylpyruvate isomerase N-terminal domain-containing protein, partial [Modestobacter versicolor]